MVRRTVRLALTIPILALFGAAFLEIEPGSDAVTTHASTGGGETLTFTVFPLILAAFDPIVWTSMGNSLAVASAVAIGSLIVGVGIGEALGRHSIPGRAAWSALILAPAVIAPSFLSLGILGLLGDQGPAGWPQRFPWPWLVWTWSAIVPGVALVAWATCSTRRALGHGMEDAARLAGAGSLRAWWDVSWPVIRPIAGGVTGFLFTTTISDPGPPLILNLRRTIAFQLLVSSRGRSPFPRTAALGLLLLAVAVTGVVAFHLWGRAWRAAPPQPDGRPLPPLLPRGWLRASLLGILLAGWSLLAWTPVAGLLNLSAQGVREDGLAGALSGSSVAIIGRSIGLGVLLAVAGIIASRAGRSRPDALEFRTPARRPSRLLGIMPPLLIGIGILSIARVAGIASVWADRPGGWPALGGLLRAASWVLDPYAIPGFLVLIGGCVDMFWKDRSAAMPAGQAMSDETHRADQALVAGAGSRRANRLARTGSVRSASRIALLSTLGATAIAPAIFLAILPESQPLGPSVVHLAGLPGGERFRAATLALCAIAMCLLALGWAIWARTRSRVSTHEHLIG